MLNSTHFPDRANRLTEFFGDLTLSQDFSLLKSTKIQDELLNNLSATVKLYLVDTLQSYYSEEFDTNVDLVKQYRVNSLRNNPSGQSGS